jgi:hypothetical protein
MIPMTCPNCGRRGTVPPDRLNTRMRCKKCEAIFFMDRSGKIVLGDPDVVLKKGGGSKHAAGAKGGKKQDEVFATSFTELFLKSPIWFKAICVALVGGTLIYFSGGLTKMKFGPTMPKNIEGLTEYIGNAFADGKPDKIKKISLPGSDADVQKWYDDLRPKFQFEGPQGPGKQVQMTYSSVSENSNEAFVLLNLLFLTPDILPEVAEQKKAKGDDLKKAEDSGYKWDGSFTVPLHYTKSGEVWQFDPAKSFTAAQPRPKETTKKKR